jgi:tRNA threonylcarbamoyladenosine biosynthesis protein TsaE
MSEVAPAEVVASGRLSVRTEPDMVRLGRALASDLRAGDLVVLTGDLGAGKTTLTRGIGEGLGVRGAVTSPTFVIARVHPAPAGRPPLVHVDAYRLGSLEEIDDLDLDAAQEDSVTVVEWGRGLAEDLAPARLELEIHRPLGHGAGRQADRPDDESRAIAWRAVGERWRGFALDRLDGLLPSAPQTPA